MDLPVVFAWKIDPRASLTQPTATGVLTLCALEGIDLWTGQMQRVRTGVAIAIDDDYWPVFLPHPQSPYAIIAGAEVIRRETVLHVVNLGPSLLHLERGSPTALVRLLPIRPFDLKLEE